jgi:phage terminase large subunit
VIRLLKQSYRTLPKEEREKVKSRFVTVGAADKAELARCAADPVYWFKYCKTYDPRLLPGDPLIPFALFPRQEAFIRWLQDREAAQEDGMAEKSRDVGFTYLCAAYALHGWLFRKGFSAGFGSRKEQLVDRKGDPDSIFEKVRILLASLPDWMRPAGFKEADHDNHMRLINPANGSTITGEAGENIGRGGRKTIYFVDEAAFLEQPKTVERALSQTSNVKVWVSTPNGMGNLFFEKRHSGKVPVFTFHWRDDPRKDDAWYARQKESLDPVTVAQEIDIDYTASIEGITIPAKWVRAAVGLALPANGPVIAGYDVAGDGDNADRNVLIARQGPKVLPPVDWGGLNTTQSAWKARDEAVRLGASVVNYDVGGMGEGVKGTWNSSETPLPFKTNPIQWGEPASETRKWPDGKTSREKFVNLRAELWFLLRERFRKAYEHVTDGIPHPPEDMISLPNHPQLISDLSLPLNDTTETGKIRLESKPKMRQRGVKSPDFGDALAYSFKEDESRTVETSAELYDRIYNRASDDEPSWL